MKNRIENISLKPKFIIILVLFVMIPIIIISIIVYKEIYQNTIESETTLRQTNLINTISSVEMTLKEYEKVIERFYDCEDILKMAYLADTISADMDTKGRIKVDLTRMRSTQDFIGSIGLIFPDKTSVYSNSGYGGYQHIENYNNLHMDRFLKQMHNPKGYIEWRSNNQPDGSKFIECNKTVKNIYDKYKVIGTIVLHISSTFLEPIEALNTYEEKQLFIITDCENKVIWSSNSVEEWDTEKIRKIVNQVSDTERMVLNTYKGESDEYYYIYQMSKYTNWNYINLIEKNDILTQVNTFTRFFIAILILLLLFFTAFVVMINYYVIRPIQKLIVFMNDVDALDKIEMSIPVERYDEVGYLYKSYNKLNNRITHLIRQLEEVYKEDKDKEIKLLQSQLNPHFIYNTLESISWVTYAKNMPEISKVLNSLSTILRYSVKHTDRYVTFEKEVEMLHHYIFIQHFRFEDRFQVTFNIDQDLLEYKTIKFIFQPFVENALVHGFKDMNKDCRITIRMILKEDNILIEIQDNGCGMSPYQLEHVRQRDTGGIGIHNIDKSLQLRFGQEYSIQIESEVGKGTCVKIRNPLIK